MRFIRIIAGISLSILLFSCLGMENNYTINENGSGKLIFQYRVSQIFEKMGKSEGQPESKEAPLPISKEELEKKFANVEGIRIINVTQWRDESDIFVKGEIEFASVEALNKSELFADMPITFVQQGGVTTFIQLITEGHEPIDKESLDMYKSLFEGYEMVFKINAPRKISSASLGVIAADGRAVTLKINMLDFMQLTARTEFKVSW